jgi:hypothetical protein
LKSPRPVDRIQSKLRGVSEADKRLSLSPALRERQG